MNYSSMIKLRLLLIPFFLLACSDSLFGMQSSSHILEEHTTHTKEDELSRFAKQRQLQLFGFLYNLEAMESLPKELIKLIAEYDASVPQVEWMSTQNSGTVFQVPQVVKTIFEAHENVIRCIIPLSQGGFATAARNDPVVKFWNAYGKDPIECTSKMNCINTLVQLDDGLVVAGGFTLDKKDQVQKLVQWTRIAPWLKEFEGTLSTIFEGGPKIKNQKSRKKLEALLGFKEGEIEGFKDDEKSGAVLCAVPVGHPQKTAFVCGSSDGSIDYCDPALLFKKSLQKAGNGHAIIALAYLGDERVVSVSENSKINIWSFSHDVNIPAKVGPIVESLDFDDLLSGQMIKEKVNVIEPVDQTTLIIGCERGYLTRWNIEKAYDSRLGWGVGEKISYIKSLAHGELFLILQTGELIYYNPKNNVITAVPKALLSRFTACALLPSNHLVSGDMKGNIRIWS